MKNNTNELGQPIGFTVDGWSDAEKPQCQNIMGQFCRLEPLDPDRHANDLFAAFSTDNDNRNWTYLPYGPFQSIASFDAWLRAVSKDSDPFFYAIIDLKTERTVGLASYLRINPSDGVIEVGHIHFSPLIQRTSISTEAMYLMMRQVFEVMGYRRYEWKCDALNEPSRKAALRLGYKFEGIFRQLTMYKGRNRDTAWFAMTDKDWSSARLAYKSWLAPDNFDDAGNQKSSLGDYLGE